VIKLIVVILKIVFKKRNNHIWTFKLQYQSGDVIKQNIFRLLAFIKPHHPLIACQLKTFSGFIKLLNGRKSTDMLGRYFLCCMG